MLVSVSYLCVFGNPYGLLRDLAGSDNGLIAEFLAYMIQGLIQFFLFFIVLIIKYAHLEHSI